MFAAHFPLRNTSVTTVPSTSNYERVGRGDPIWMIGYGKHIFIRIIALHIFIRIIGMAEHLSSRSRVYTAMHGPPLEACVACMYFQSCYNSSVHQDLMICSNLGLISLSN